MVRRWSTRTAGRTWATWTLTYLLWLKRPTSRWPGETVGSYWSSARVRPILWHLGFDAGGARWLQSWGKTPTFSVMESNYSHASAQQRVRGSWLAWRDTWEETLSLNDLYLLSLSQRWWNGMKYSHPCETHICRVFPELLWNILADSTLSWISVNYLFILRKQHTHNTLTTVWERDSFFFVT